MTKQQQVAVMMAVLVVLAGGICASAATCSVSELTVCAPAISSGAKPTAACCSTLKAKQGCFCQLAKNPTYAPYINSPNARKIVASCGLTVPRC